MSNPHDERTFGDMLRQAARATQPEYSESLERDICCAVRQSQADAASLQPAGSRGVRLRWAALAVAAVLVLAVVFAWRSGSFVHVSQGGLPLAVDASLSEGTGSAGAPSLPLLIDRAALEVDRLMREKFVTEQWAYLEHDARVLANAVTGGSLRHFVEPSAHAPQADRTPARPEGG